MKGQTVLRAAVSGGAPVSASEIRGFAVGLDWRDEAIVQGDVGGGLFRVRLALDGGARATS